MAQAQLSPLQQTLIKVVRRYPGQFSRSGLAKMLVGARSWQDRDYPEYGQLAPRRRRDVLYQVDILLQQGFLAQDRHGRLISAGISTPNG